MVCLRPTADRFGRTYDLLSAMAVAALLLLVKFPAFAVSGILSVIVWGDCRDWGGTAGAAHGWEADGQERVIR